MEIKKFFRQPGDFDCIYFDGNNAEEVLEFCHGSFLDDDHPELGIVINENLPFMSEVVEPGWYILRNNDNDTYLKISKPNLDFHDVEVTE